MTSGDRMNLPLGPIHQLAADYIQTHGWTQGTEVNERGEVCLTGALRLCAPVAGDGYLAREVYRKRGHAEAWNDDNSRTSREVIGWLRSAEITDTDLADTFGPQWEQIVVLVRRASVLTEAEANSLAAARAAVRGAAWDAAWGAAWGVSARAAARDAAWAAARGAAAWDAAWGAALGLVVRDFIGQSFTQEQYDLLTGPWRRTIGPIHPDDAGAVSGAKEHPMSDSPDLSAYADRDAGGVEALQRLHAELENDEAALRKEADNLRGQADTLHELQIRVRRKILGYPMLPVSEEAS